MGHRVFGKWIGQTPRLPALGVWIEPVDRIDRVPGFFDCPINGIARIPPLNQRTRPGGLPIGHPVGPRAPQGFLYKVMKLLRHQTVRIEPLSGGERDQVSPRSRDNIHPLISAPAHGQQPSTAVPMCPFVYGREAQSLTIDTQR